MEAIWKPIPGYPGYEASDDGRVRSTERTVIRHRYGKAIPVCRRGKLLTPTTGKNGYPKVEVSGRTESVHRLVAAAFHGLCPDNHEVAHADGDRANSSAANLRYATRTENAADRRVHGTDSSGARGAGAKLTEAQVREIRALRGLEKQRDIAARYGVSHAAVGYAQRNETWKGL